MKQYGARARAEAHAAGRPSRCLEWDGPWYLAQYKECEETWTLAYSKRAGKLLDHRRLFADLTRPIASQLPDMVGTFDLIFCNQVFEHVAQPHVAATAVAMLLRPGGFLLWSAPFLEPTHAVPYDFFRYTISGGVRLFRDVGLGILATEKGGDSMLTSAYLLGYSPAELPNASAVGEQLSAPVTEAELAAIARNDSKAELGQKLYFASFVVAKRPNFGRLYEWVRSPLPLPPPLLPPNASSPAWGE